MAESFALGNPMDALDAFARHASDCVRLVDLDGRVLWWNAACERLYGWTAEEVVGERLPHVPPADRLRAIRNIRDVAASGVVAERETIGVRADGSQFALRMTVIPIVDADGDVSGVMSLTNALAADTRMEREREHFAEVISRQLRGPMNAIRGYVQLLGHAEIRGDEERLERTVHSLAREAHRVSALLDDLMVVFEFEEGRLELEKSRVNLGELVSHLAEAVDSHGVPVLVDFDPGLGQIPADAPRLRQAIACLIDNAVRYTPPGAAVQVSAYAEGDDAVIEVVDHGPGIPYAEQPIVFDRFHTGGADDDAREGIGIGLYLVRVTVDAHGGSVSVASAPGEGSTFTLRLPRNPTDTRKATR